MEKFKVNFIKKVAEKLTYFGIDFGVDEFIACQFALESNFGRSNIARLNQNFCGMRSPKIRITLDFYPASTWAAFDSLDECILDYVLWLSWNHFTMFDVQNIEKFKSKLVSSKYCPEKDYINKIQTIYNQFKSSQNGN